jgi:3-phytase
MPRLLLQLGAVRPLAFGAVASTLSIPPCGWAATLPVRVQTTVTPRVTLAASGIGDQDDMCIWIHPTIRTRSTIITSDKGVNKLFVYDLSGSTVQVVSTPGKPGNIDVRYAFPLGGGLVDIVAVNDRTNSKLLVYLVSPIARTLTRSDNRNIVTLSNYGSCMYHSLATDTYYAFTTSQSGVIGQYRLSEQAGAVAGTLVRSWDIGGQTEACVCDDQTGFAYFAEEAVGIWKIGAEPTDATSGSLIAHVNDASGLQADVEGLTIYYEAGGGGYILASSQGNSTFKVYDRAFPHAYVETFSVTGVTSSDGADVTNVSLGPNFPSGIFASHNDTPAAKTVEVCAYQDLGLSINTVYWDPRNSVPTDAAIGDGAIRVANYPNPFHPSTRVLYQLSQLGPVHLVIHDARGRAVISLASGVREAGVHEVVWDGRDSRGQQVADGVYFVTLDAGGQRQVGKMVRMR